MMAFEEKVAIVTGGGRGLGKAYCLALLNEGVKICICDINEETSIELIQGLPEILQKNVIFRKCDVTNCADFKDAFDKTVSTFGKINIVVNNAGVCGESTWRKTIDVNFIGVLHGIQLGLQYMSLENDGEGGFIVNTSSIAGLLPSPLIPVYGATKHAVVGLTRSYGSEYHFKKTGVKVMAICPDGVDTDLLRDIAKSSLDEAKMETVVKSRCMIEVKCIGEALIKVLKDGRNGSVLRMHHDSIEYV